MSQVSKLIIKLLTNILAFSQYASQITLRSYQKEPALAIINSIFKGLGHTIVVIMPRQSGKNELQAQIEAYVMRRLSQIDVEIVKASPTWKPQSLNAMRRLEKVLSRNILTRHIWKKEMGFIFTIGKAHTSFVSGAPETNIVGLTATHLLQIDEAQDIQIQKFDKDLVNMAASTNATRVFWGTPWTSKTLLAREMRAAREAEKLDGVRRVFMYDAHDVRKESPPYGDFVDQQIAKLGRNHPLIRTQLFSQEIETEGGMFPPARCVFLQGNHPPHRSPQPNHIYAMLLDLAGEDEQATEEGDFSMANEARDHTALTIVSVDLASLSDPLIEAPTYNVVFRKEWLGHKHTTIYAELKAIALHWSARYVVSDATGIGAGVTSFLAKALPEKVIPFVFSQASKSTLGWAFIGMVETGRFKDYALDPEDELQQRFRKQLEYCQLSAIVGPSRAIKWGVPDGTRDHSGNLVHDDLLVSAALSTVLDTQIWGTAVSELIAPYDPIGDMDSAF